MGQRSGRIAVQVLTLMCGIAGIISSQSSILKQQVLDQMAASLSHRGPDDQDTWINENHQVGFAHRRLCVIDISKAGRQPMHYLDRYSIVYNGEIYNYVEVREQLKARGVQFRTASDTEVILAAYATYGKQCLQLFDGMFSFALWDEKEQELFCARDRFGEKPFYYFHHAKESSFYFASELKAFPRAGVKRSWNNSLLLEYLAVGSTSSAYDPSQTFDHNILRLPASHYLVYSKVSGTFKVTRYWDLDTQPRSIKFEDAVGKFMDLLHTSVSRRLRSDVSLGMSLSGGLDSSSIAALVSPFIKKRIDTFTATFPGFTKDELEQARKTAQNFGYNNYEVRPTAEGLVKDFERLLIIQEEPFTSSSVYAQFKVFELAAAEGVTVLLDGQGADETLAGYEKFLSWKKRSYLPKMTAKLLEFVQKRQIRHDPDVTVDYRTSYAPGIEVLKPVVRNLNDLLYYNIFNVGLEELLRYADRNSMAHGKEVRLPFLNHELVCFVFSLPSEYKIHKGFTKFILREALRNKLPESVVYNRRKTGFEPPQKSWMANSALQELTHESKRTLVNEGILNKKVLAKPLQAHEAYARRGKEWRWLIAGGLVALNKKGV